MFLTQFYTYSQFISRVTFFAALAPPFLWPNSSLWAKGRPDPLLECIPGCFSPVSVVNLFCTCKPLGGAASFLLVLEVTSFYHSPEVVLSLKLDVDTACFSAAVRVHGYLTCCISEKILSSPMPHNLLSSFCNPSTWWHSSCRTEGHSSLHQREALDSASPMSCRTVSATWSSSLRQRLCPSSDCYPNTSWGKLLYHVSPPQLNTQLLNRPVPSTS